MVLFLLTLVVLPAMAQAHGGHPIDYEMNSAWGQLIHWFQHWTLPLVMAVGCLFTWFFIRRHKPANFLLWSSALLAVTAMILALIG